MDTKYKIKAVIFDFDGVIANTDLYHFISWKKAIRIIGINMDQSSQKYLRGLTREATLEKILNIFDKKISTEEFEEVLLVKNELYKEFLKDISIDDVLPGIVVFLEWLKKNDFKIGMASISKNAESIVKNIGIGKYFDVIVNPNKINKIKPEPDIFIMAADLLNVNPWECIGIEDSQVGIDAINSSLMVSIGIDFHGDLENCYSNLDSTSKLTPEYFENLLSQI